MGWRNGTHDVRMIETLEHPHLTPHAFLVPFDLWLSPSELFCDLACDVPGLRLARGISQSREGERGSGESVGFGGGEGMNGAAARRSATVYYSGEPCRARPYSMTMMWGS